MEPQCRRIPLRMRRIDKMYHEAFKPFEKDKGTAYPSHQSHIDFHKKSLFQTPNNGPFAYEVDATVYMMSRNSLTRSVSSPEQAAIDRLAAAVRDFQKGGYTWGPDLAIKAFSDLDRVFFGGHLSGNVCVSWGSHKTSSCRLHSELLGSTSRKIGIGEHGQCRIMLNADTIFTRTTRKDPFELMMGTLLHEMVHAYEYVRCPASKELDGDGGGHDAHFGTRIRVLHDRAERLFGLKVIGDHEPYVQRLFVTIELEVQGGKCRRSRR